MAGLDPAIHLLRKNFSPRMMDPRVKPAGDGERTAAHAESIRFAKSSYEERWTTRNRVYPISGILGAQVG
jgi:hypothetical protein